LRHFLKEGDTFIDCGANAGFYSVFANDVMSGKGVVVAIEANPALLPQLDANFRANGIDRPAIHAAVTLRPGVARLFVPDQMDVVGGLRRTPSFGSGASSHVAVPGITIDHVVVAEKLSSVDMIKIDIEGGEMDALRSAEQTVRTFRPILIVEYSSTNWPEYGATPDDLRRLCAAWNYEVCRFDVQSLKPVPVDPAFWNEPYANMVLMPGERSERGCHS
jgi:FkbM family methyltransferase